MTVHIGKGMATDPTLVARVTASAVVLPTGGALLLMAGDGPRVPDVGQLEASGEQLSWQAKVFARREGSASQWSAIALVEALPRADGLLLEPAGTSPWGVTIGTRVGTSATDLLDRARAIGTDMAEVFHLLVDLLDRHRQVGGPQERPFRAFVQDFLDSVAIHDGFVELVVEPQTGGLLLQGWSQSLRDTPLRWISLVEPLADPVMTVAFFDRPDLLSPAKGVCLFHKDLKLQASNGWSAGYFEQDGRLFRLDLVSSPIPSVSGPGAAEHVVRMLQRLQGPQAILAPFRRICRPLFDGEDTLTPTRLPVAMGLDVVLRAPDGALLVVGWLLDPDGLVDMVLIKSGSDRYARISEDWVRLPRSDLIQAFAADPRFAGRIDAQDVMSGFIVRVPRGPDPRPEEELYLELLLEDHQCLFRPLRATTPCTSAGLQRLLAGLSPNEPELARIIDDHLVPILSCLRPALPTRRKDRASHPVPLGRKCDPAPVGALMPFTTFDELQPVLSLLAGTPEGRGLDLTLVAPRPVVEEVLDPLDQAFRFYGLTGQVLPAPTSNLRTLWLDAALDATMSEHILIWSPQALPKAAGWLGGLIAELAFVDRAGMISPLLTYEDGSVRFGPSAPGRISALGFAPGRLVRSDPVVVQTAAAEIALMPRDRLITAGGFAGNLFSDAFVHVDLSMRVTATGARIWCSSRVEFWCLDDPGARGSVPADRILQRVDARLLVQRGAPDPKEHFQ